MNYLNIIRIFNLLYQIVMVIFGGIDNLNDS